MLPIAASPRVVQGCKNQRYLRANLQMCPRVFANVPACVCLSSVVYIASKSTRADGRWCETAAGTVEHGAGSTAGAKGSSPVPMLRELLGLPSPAPATVDSATGCIVSPSGVRSACTPLLRRRHAAPMLDAPMRGRALCSCVLPLALCDFAHGACPCIVCSCCDSVGLVL